jgi:hypothetical protein
MINPRRQIQGATPAPRERSEAVEGAFTDLGHFPSNFVLFIKALAQWP